MNAAVQRGTRSMPLDYAAAACHLTLLLQVTQQALLLCEQAEEDDELPPMLIAFEIVDGSSPRPGDAVVMNSRRIVACNVLTNCRGLSAAEGGSLNGANDYGGGMMLIAIEIEFMLIAIEIETPEGQGAEASLPV